MKKILIFSTALSLLLSTNNVAVSAAERAELPESIYQQLLEHEGTDINKDGVITEEEYCSSTYLSLDLDGIDSIDFLSRLKQPKYMYLANGNISDFSSLAKFSSLETLQLNNMPEVTDISFAKDMELKKFYISSLEQITDEQKVAVMKFYDADTAVGFSDMIGATPTGMFTYDEITIGISDTDIASFDVKSDNPVMSCAASVYGKAKGTTEYSLKLHGKEIHKGSVSVSEISPTVLPSSKGQSAPKIFESSYYSSADKIVLKDGTLYTLANGEINAIAEKVADFNKDYTYNENGDFIKIEIILYQDGTVEVNGEKLLNADKLHFKAVGLGFCIADNGDVYAIRQEKGHYVADLIYNGFDRFLEHSSMNFISDTGEVIQIELKKNGSTTIGYQAFPTGIMNVTDSYNEFFIDNDKVLWKINRHVGSTPSVKKCAEDVVYVGYRYYSKGSTYGCVHITSDGTAYMAGSAIQVVLTDKSNNPVDYKSSGKFELDYPNTGTTSSGFVGAVSNCNYHITNDNILCMEYAGIKTAVADVDSYITTRRISDGNDVYAYFLKTDNTIWSYSFAKDKYINVSDDTEAPRIRGDVNNDDNFDISDVVLLQKWLLAVPDTKLKNPKAADLIDDNRLDVFDLCFMKKELISKS